MENERRKLQLLILEIANEVKRICDNNGIKYFLLFGSCLGAVRHKGFIPWDDDMDIGMLRKDYIRFLKICNKELSPKFYLQTLENEINYPFEFSKIQIRNTTFIEDFSKDAEVSHGIFLDIFPIDQLPNNQLERRIYKLNNKILKNLIWVKCGYGSRDQKHGIKYKIFSLLSHVSSINRMKSLRRNLLEKYSLENMNECFIGDYPKKVLPIILFSDTKEYEFEGNYFSGIKDYDNYLTLLYGNYMQLPPESKRSTHSNYQIDFGPYSD